MFVSSLCPVVTRCTHTNTQHPNLLITSGVQGSPPASNTGGRKFAFILFEAAFSLHPGVIILFWASLFHSHWVSKSGANMFLMVHTHGIAFVWLLMDLYFSKIEFKRSHLILIIPLAIFYTIVSTIYNVMSDSEGVHIHNWFTAAVYTIVFASLFIGFGIGKYLSSINLDSRRSINTTQRHISYEPVDVEESDFDVERSEDGIIRQSSYIDVPYLEDEEAQDIGPRILLDEPEDAAVSNVTDLRAPAVSSGSRHSQSQSRSPAPATPVWKNPASAALQDENKHDDEPTHTSDDPNFNAQRPSSASQPYDVYGALLDSNVRPRYKSDAGD